VHTLFSYRKFCATTSSSGQLILPEALKLLPLYSLAVTKCPMLRTETPADVRVRQLVSFMSLSVSFVVPRLYPRMFAVRAHRKPKHPVNLTVEFSRPPPRMPPAARRCIHA
jgi:protein transport protein SEC24